MKKKLLFGLCCIALAGCTADIDDTNSVVMYGAPQIKISGHIEQEYISRVNDGGFCQDDQVGLFGVNYTDNNTLAGELLDEGNQVDNARYTYDEANNQWVASGNIYYKDSKTNIDLYGYYPYGTVNSVSEYAFEVQQDQSGNNSVDGYAQSDFLWGKATNIAPTEQKIKILFNHKMACANVVLVEGENFAEGEFASLKKSVLVMNTSRTSTINLATGVISATGEVESEGIVMKSNEEGYKAIVVPQTVAAGASLFSITVDGVAYRFKKDVDFTYEQGKQAKFTIEVSKKVPSGDYEFSLVDCEIIDWVADIDTHGGEARQYYVVHQEEPGTLSAKLRAAKKDPTKIKNLKISGKIDAADFYFMRDSMTVLQAINLKETKICTFTKASAFSNGIVTTASWENDYDAATNTSYYDYVAYKNSRYYYTGAENTIPNGALSQKKTLTNFVFPEYVVAIENAAFYYCNLLSGALILPDDVTSIGNNCFHYCRNITSLSLPQKLEVIGGEAFNYCTGLTCELNLPLSIKKIDRWAFANCTGVYGTLILPSNLEYLGPCAFNGCSGLTGNLVIPETITTIDEATFSGCSGFDGQLVLHDNLSFESAGKQFYNCRFQGELKLPAQLDIIPQSCFYGCHFSSIAPFPESLIGIEGHAFYDCYKLTGVIEFPNSLVSLGSYAFNGCRNIEGIILPNGIGLLPQNAFNGCSMINKLVCKSIEPPVVKTGVFGSVPKDNFTLEVPEQSIQRYASDSQWGEFKRIGAYHDFSISRRQMRVLNAGHSREFILRAPANYAWSIESKPDWCTITPSSGVGKQNVVVTVSEMTDSDVATFEINTGAYNSPKYEAHNGRAGEIVFLLNDKNYRTTLKVEQYDADVADGQVIVNQTATEGNGVNIVFMGDCFDARDIANGSYLKGINEAIGYYFDIEPYKTYKPYFNIYTVVGMSNDSGMGTVNTIRDAKFGSQYISENVSANTALCFEYACKASTVNEENLCQTLIVMVENTNEYGGLTQLWDDGSAISFCPISDDAYPYDFRGIIQHEAGGHGFAKLGDENAINPMFLNATPAYQTFIYAKGLGFYRNISDSSNPEKVDWSHFIFHSKYSNIVDIYEGAWGFLRGAFRSEANSCMNNNIPYYNAISRQAIVERIMQYAGKEFSWGEFYETDKQNLQVGTRSTIFSAEDNITTFTGAGKQMPPKFMGDKLQLKKSNK